MAPRSRELWRGGGRRLTPVLAPLLAAPLALALALAPTSAPRAADYDGDAPDYVLPPDDAGERPGEGGRKSTWELNTSLTFYRYLEPFPRVDSARACRDRCGSSRRCTGWTYYDANFNEAGRYSYKLQRVCVLGAGVKDKQSGNRPGRTSGVMRAIHQSAGDGGSGEE